MTHANHDSAKTRTWLRTGLALLVLPALLFVTACDSNDSDGVNQQPDADFSIQRDGLSATFSDQSEDPDGSIDTRSWELGDGTEVSDSSSVTHTYDAEGTYDVKLSVEDADGASDDITKPVTVEMGEVSGPNYANYDTTRSGGEQVIEFRERSDNQAGVVPEVTEGNPNVRENYVKWTSDQTYLIDGRTFVNPGDTLEIEPGTVVKGIPNQDPTNASVLVVANEGHIIADGNPGSSDPSNADPIIFTTREDDVSDPNDLSRNLDGAWGGVIILGNGPKNFPGSRSVEGIPSDVDRAVFGSSSPDDDYNAGTFRFASIRYGGISIGAGNEINGLTMGALGSGTTIEYVEVFNNQDDGFEWFGGNVNAHHLVSSRNGDDSFDIDQGYSGNLQFLLAVQTLNRGDRTGEHDSGDDGFGANNGETGEGDEPIANPQIYNATYVGSGADGDGDVALKLRDNFGGNYFNSVFYDFPLQFVEVEDVTDDQGNDIGPDSRDRWEGGMLTIENSVTWKFASVEDPDNPYVDLVENSGSWGETLASDLENYNVTYEDPGISRTLSENAFQSLNPVPSNNLSSDVTPQGDFFEQVSYKGAFEPSGNNWAKGWTFSDEVGMFE